MIKVRKTAARRIDNRIDIQNKDERASIYFYGDIGGMFGIDPLDFIGKLNGIKSPIIDWRVDSGGGDIFSARTIKTAVMQHPSKIIAHVDGVAGSAMSFAIMGANEIEIVDGGFMFIHNALSFLDVLGYFNLKAIEELVNSLNKEKDLQVGINKSIANDYFKRTGKSVDSFLEMMEAETWFNANQALEIGFVDRIYDGTPVDNKYDLSIYNNVPDVLRKRSNMTSDSKKDINERELEKNLRDAGYSRNQAKDIVAKVFRDERDAQSEPDNPDVRDVQTDDGADQRDADQTPRNDGDNQIDNLAEAKKIVDPNIDALNRAKKLLIKEKEV